MPPSTHAVLIVIHTAVSADNRMVRGGRFSLHPDFSHFSMHVLDAISLKVTILLEAIQIRTETTFRRDHFLVNEILRVKIC